jgi:hypothetical protein
MRPSCFTNPLGVAAMNFRDEVAGTQVVVFHLLLTREIKALATEKLKHGLKYQNHDLIFCRPDGSPLHPQTFLASLRAPRGALG